MERYTIEDIELIRKKSGISYQEAVALLDYHNGNVARALVDLERNGRIKPENAASTGAKPAHEHKKGGFSNLMSRLYRFRVKVRKGDTPILNLSLLFSILAVLVSPHVAIIGAILCLVLGYHISFDKDDADFASDNLEAMVKNAAQNVKQSAESIAHEFTSDAAKNGTAAKKAAAPEAKATAPEAPKADSYYTSNPAATTHGVDYTGRAPVLQVPVQVESQDGTVEIEEDKDGFNNATIQ